MYVHDPRGEANEKNLTAQDRDFLKGFRFAVATAINFFENATPEWLGKMTCRGIKKARADFEDYMDEWEYNLVQAMFEGEQYKGIELNYREMLDSRTREHTDE